MFNKKKKCPKCNRKIEKDYDFCPFCGHNFRNRFDELEKLEKDFGMFGKNDSIEQDINDFRIKLPMGFGKLFNSLVKELDKQFRELDKEIGKEKNEKNEMKKMKFPPGIKSGGLSISISSNRDNKPKIRVKSFGNMPQFKNQGQNIEEIKKSNEKNKLKEIKPKLEMSEDKIKKLKKLPKEEPSTNIRRLSDKIIYEIDVPEVKSKKDVIIQRLENSIEIKALGKKKAYFKLLPVSLPIAGYKVSKGKLILELIPEKN